MLLASQSITKQNSNQASNPAGKQASCAAGFTQSVLTIGCIRLCYGHMNIWSEPSGAGSENFKGGGSCHV